MRVSWYVAASVCVAALSRETSIVLERAGIERLPTTKTMAATTVISARVNPACKAQASPDLFLAFTVFSAFPDSIFELKNQQRFRTTFSWATAHCASTNPDVARSEFARLKVTNVGELLYRNILTRHPQARG